MQTKIPDDGFVPGAVPVGMNPPGVPLPMGPAAEPEFDNSRCLAGPCIHLWQIKTSFASGNPEGTFAPGAEPKKISRSCTASPSEEMDLAGLTVFDCDRWQPKSESQLLAEKKRELEYQERLQKGTK